MLELLAALLLAQGQQPPCGWQLPGLPTLPATLGVNVPAYGDCELYFLDGPDPATVGANGAPLLVLFHGFGDPSTGVGSHEEYLPGNPYWGQHDLVDRALCAGWYVVMHDGGEMPGTPNPHYNTFGNERFQRATEAVLADVTTDWPINEDRIYGVGFSMGGGEVLAYASRHVDPTKPMFAGVLTQSGYLSPIYSYAQSCLIQIVGVYDGLHYCGNEFHWQRGSAFDLDLPWGPWSSSTGCGVASPVCGIDPLPADWNAVPVSLYDSQVNNVVWMPTQLYYNENTSTGTFEDSEVIEVNEKLHAWMTGTWGGAPITLDVIDCGNPALTCTTISPFPGCVASGPANCVVHGWEGVCSNEVVGFFDPGPGLELTKQKFLARANGKTNLTLMAEDEQRYHHFEALRLDPDDFARVAWRFVRTSNQLQFLEPPTPNLERLRIRVDDQYSVLDPTQQMFLSTPSNWTAPVVRLELSGYPTDPGNLVVYQNDSVNPEIQLTIGNGLLHHDPIDGVIWWEVTDHGLTPNSAYTWRIP